MTLSGDSWQTILDRVKKADKAARLASIVDLEGKMKTRIHMDGLKSDGSQIGQYKPKWKRIREQKQRQTDFVNLEFYGDLRRGLQTGTLDDVPVLGFNSEQEFIKATGLSFGNGKWNGYGEIYTPTPDEIQELYDSYALKLEIEFNALI